IDRLGTNLLTVTNGSTAFGNAEQLPEVAPAMIGRIAPVLEVADMGNTGATAYRTPYINKAHTNALSVQAVTSNLPSAVGTTVAQGAWLNAATENQPVAVLGAAAAQRLGIDTIQPGERIWVGGRWFYVVGVLKPAVLAPEIDNAILVGRPAAATYLKFDGHPTTI